MPNTETHICPHCGRKDFKKLFGLTNHINKCPRKADGLKFTLPKEDNNNYKDKAPTKRQLTQWKAEHNPNELNNLKIIEKKDGYWITNFPEHHKIPEGCGPYKHKHEAREDKEGLIRTHKNMYTPGYITTCSQ